MAKKPLTKSQIVSHSAKKFEISERTTSAILGEVVPLAISKTKKTGPFTLHGTGKLVPPKADSQIGRNPTTGGGGQDIG